MGKKTSEEEINSFGSFTIFCLGGRKTGWFFCPFSCFSIIGDLCHSVWCKAQISSLLFLAKFIFLTGKKYFPNWKNNFKQYGRLNFILSRIREL